MCVFLVVSLTSNKTRQQLQKNIEHMHYLIKLPIARGLRSQARSLGARTNNKNEEIAPILEIPKYESS